MTWNPFIELARDPVGVLSLLGGVAFLASTAVMATVYPVRAVPDLYAQFTLRERHEKWHSGPSDVGYVPPVGWILMAASVPLSIAIAFWSVAALVWVVG